MTELIDIDLYGREYREGVPYEWKDADAVNNAILLWITSKRSDYIKNPEAGGVLDSIIFKLMTDSQIEKLKFRIRNAFARNFSEYASLQEIKIEKMMDLRLLKITVYYINIPYNTKQSLDLYVETEIKVESFKYEDVEYIGENLYNFVVTKKPSMVGKKLAWNTKENYFCWNKFRFINFTTEDEYYTQILAYINT